MKIALATASLAAFGLLAVAGSAQAATPDAAARENWRAALARLSLPANGCFTANYPDAAWTRTACVTAPHRAYIPRHGGNATAANGGQTVGNGNDYAAVVSSFITQGVGSFPSVTGVTSETDSGKNIYSLQENANFFTTSVCNGATNPSSCLGWQQFVYSSSERSAFMQYWLINYGNSCPSGWYRYAPDCYKNSAAVSVPKIAITLLANLSITGTAAANGTDKMIFTNGTKAYTTSGSDSVVKLAYGWKESEFNVVGDGGGSAATFNTGSNITVKIALTDGSTAAPQCESNDGTTGETNNLTLGSCSTASGTPSITFTEKK